MFQPKSFGQIPSKSLLALAVTAAISTNSHAGNIAQPLSYEADGNCYCTESVTSSDIAKTITPTPVGGQTLAQVCKRLGAGPGLVMENGEYNHPAYTDAQCGHGPMVGNVEDECTLLNANGDSICGTTGPKWNIAEAYAKPAAPEQSKPVAATQNIASKQETNALPTVTEQSTRVAYYQQHVYSAHCD